MPPTTSFSLLQQGQQITRSDSSWANLGSPTTVSYAFRATAPTTGSEAPTFSRFNANEIAATRIALQEWRDVANIRFDEVGGGGFSDDATMLFANFTGAGNSAGHAYLPITKDRSPPSPEGDTWLNLNSSPYTTFGYGSYDFSTIIHEIGHAIGLDHPGDYNAGDEGPAPIYQVSAPYIEDTLQYSIMSYFPAASTGANHVAPNGTLISASTPLLADIAAAQRLYGANTATRLGPDTYGFNATAGDHYRIADGNAQAVFTIYDSGGINTLDLSGYATSQAIDLRDGAFSNAGALTRNISIAPGTVVHNARGGGGNDAITGNIFDNGIFGGPGNDLIDGGAGIDTSSHAGAARGYKISVTVGASSVAVQDKVGTDGTDTLTNVEKIQFTDAAIETAWLTKTASLSSAQLVGLTQIYIASVNRAPDAGGLEYWGSRFKDGMSLPDIAKSFFVQPETIAAYPAGQSTSEFVSKVYNNVLGRTPDAGGLSYWAGELENGHVGRDTFLLAIINGAFPPSGSPADAQYLTNKTTVGMRYALTEGLSDVGHARTVMAGVTGSPASVSAAIGLVDGFAASAASGASSELVMQIVGIVA